MKVRLKHRALADRIARSRLSQNRWAQKLGLSSGHLSLLVNGRRPYPTPDTRGKLLETLGCRFSELFEIENPRPHGEGAGPLLTESAGRLSWMMTFFQDLRWSLRLLLKQRSFSTLALLALALGIGANTAIFSVVHAVLLRPLPFDQPDRVVAFWDEGSWSKAEIAWMQQLSGTAFSDISGYGIRSVTLTGRERPAQLSSVVATGNLFDLLGTKAFRGKSFGSRDSEPGAPGAAVLSHHLWQGTFGADPEIIGRHIEIDEIEYQVTGVMAPSFFFPVRSVDLWLALKMDPQERGYRGWHSWNLTGRLAPGVSLKQAQASIGGIGRVMQEEFNYPPQFDKFAAPPPLMTFQNQTSGPMRPTLMLLLSAVGLVLLIACANVANLLLARLPSRRRELGIRLALGARRRTLLAQLLTESVLLALAGGVLGVVLAAWAIRVGKVLLPEVILQSHEIQLNGTVLIFSLLLSVLTGIFFGVVPAFQATRSDVGRLLDQSRAMQEGPGARSWDGLLVVAEVALGVVLVVAAGLTLQSLQRLYDQDLGIDVPQLVTFKTYPINQRFKDGEGRVRFYEDVLGSLKNMPGVERVGAIQNLPIEYAGWIQDLEVEHQPGDFRVYWRTIAEDYLETMGIQLVEGRSLLSSDRTDTGNVCLVNQSFRERYWPGQSALGKRIQIGTDGPDWMTIVGVTADSQFRAIGAEVEPMVYRPYRQNPMSVMMTVVLRTPLAVERLQSTFQEAVWQVDSNAPVFDEKPFQAVVAESIGSQRLITFLLSLFGLIALALGAVGIYGVISCRVNRRRFEIGVRMALGAQRRQVLEMVLSQGLILAFWGALLGIAGALATGRLLSGFLFGIGATDPVTLSVVTGLMLLTAALACYLPARRATRVDPIRALRAE